MSRLCGSKGEDAQDSCLLEDRQTAAAQDDHSTKNTSPATAGALQAKQDGLAEVQARLHNVLQHLPFQDAVEAVSAQLLKQAESPISSKQGPLPATAVDMRTQPPAGLHIAAMTQAEQSLAKAAVPGQASFSHPGSPNGHVSTAVEASATAAASVPFKKAKSVSKAEPSATAAASISGKKATSISQALAGMADATVVVTVTAEPKEQSPPMTVPVICNCLHGVFNAARTMVKPLIGSECRPHKFEERAGKGHMKKWKVTIKVDEGNGVPGVAIGLWLIDLKRKQRLTRRLSAKAKATDSVPDSVDGADSEQRPPSSAKLKPAGLASGPAGAAKLGIGLSMSPGKKRKAIGPASGPSLAGETADGKVLGSDSAKPQSIGAAGGPALTATAAGDEKQETQRAPEQQPQGASYKHVCPEYILCLYSQYLTQACVPKTIHFLYSLYFTDHYAHNIQALILSMVH